jgi:hypothetical protein
VCAAVRRREDRRVDADGEAALRVEEAHAEERALDRRVLLCHVRPPSAGRHDDAELADDPAWSASPYDMP